MRINLRIEAVQWAIIGAMFVLAAVVWPSAPDRIPVHWGPSGQPDAYGGKFEGLLLMPLIAFGVYLALLFLPRVDPQRANYAQFGRAYRTFRLAIVAFLALLYGSVLLWIEGVRLDFAVVLPVLVGGLFVLVGNLLGKIRPNWFVGIKTPWTLTSKRSWVKTHRMGGWLFVLLGLAFAGLGLAGATWANALFPAALVLGIAWLFVYSYLVWRSDPERTTETDAHQTGR